MGTHSIYLNMKKSERPTCIINIQWCQYICLDRINLVKNFLYNLKSKIKVIKQWIDIAGYYKQFNNIMSRKFWF